MKKYFLCDRFRNTITKKYVEKYIKDNKVIFYNTYDEANQHFGFVDDSDYAIMSIDEHGNIDFTNGRELR